MKTNILVCTLGGSWAVVPEVYAFLAPRLLPLYEHHTNRDDFQRSLLANQLEAPHEIWVCTTDGRTTGPGIAELMSWQRQLESAPILRLWRVNDTNELATQRECDRTQELLLRCCLLAHERANGGQVVLSLAGGRKTMSADLQWAGHLFGCHALIHVVATDKLPESLHKPVVETFLRPLPKAVVDSVVPLVAERSRRSELLDVDLDGKGPVTSERFPLPLAADRTVEMWEAPAADWLREDIRARERAGSQLLGNFLLRLAEQDHHENWRSLYRLPPRLIDELRRTLLGPEMAEWLQVLPKADLHRHLGGCLGIDSQKIVGQAIWEAMSARERDEAAAQVRDIIAEREWPQDWSGRLRRSARRSHMAAALLVHADAEQLEHNLYGATQPRVALNTRHALGFKAYELPGELSGSALLSHPAAIGPYAKEIVRQADEEGLLCVELRGSPQKYGDGLEFLRAFRDAIQRAAGGAGCSVHERFRFTVIGDRRQRTSLSEVIDMAVRAKREMGDFIAGLDIAGDEGETRPEQIADCFLPAFEICLPITIHAGEGQPADSIWEAAYHLHADRIGHGLTISDHPQLAARFRDRGICLELCPTSNREVVGFQDPQFPDSHNCPTYPLAQIWERGIPLTICTDNPGISRTTLANEYLVAARMAAGGLSLWQVLTMLKLGFTHAFLPSDVKEALLKRADGLVYRAVLDRFSSG